MNLERYSYFTTNDFQEYSFYSEGPRGTIKKIVKFMKAQDDPVIFNLGFGDENPETGMVSDAVTTDNKDRDIVLATVANTINTFCDHYGNHYIYAEGSTPARTRLYQMGISRLWSEINKDFEVMGLKDGTLSGFQQNVNYDAFLVKRKIKQ
jgi:hypothetical protein